LWAAMVVIGLGTGGITSNVSPLIAEQVRSTSAFVETRKDGKQVVVDPEITVQRIYMVRFVQGTAVLSVLIWRRFTTCALTWALCRQSRLHY
jgi:dipeptide/tripeptide permease